MQYGATPAELEERLTATDLANYQALCELDGPWWGERESAHLRQVAAITAAAAGVEASADDFKIDWTIGEAEESEPAGLSFEEGAALFVARFGGDVLDKTR